MLTMEERSGWISKTCAGRDALCERSHGSPDIGANTVRATLREATPKPYARAPRPGKLDP